ncbi:PVC-type heme-binding CxxCH protein [Bythopirellula polymerisocia]|uniref:Cytochrome c n=1 Tax=Bythopirellula polymerisocia TaxID=2528003 RepID=A0A5C6D3E9_9BACT|nr:PVC-type heme-binding CxxCH protein [Bythopirellula polymerisocia]TWU30394.1 Cytochrome c [Bythopirellula polymerisocia]
MKSLSHLLCFVVCLLLTTLSRASDQLWVAYPGGDGAGKGKHLVFLSGDEEYRSEEALPMLAKILSERHGFKCTVLFAVDPQTGEIDPNNNTSLPGCEEIDSADALITALRFRAWPAEAIERFAKAVDAGKPIIGLRTSTHAFKYAEGSPYHKFNLFGEEVFGEEWINHWGRHKQEATRGVIDPSAKEDPILHGVTNIFGDTDVYEAYPPEDAMILIRGQVLSGMQPDSQPASYSKKRSSDGQSQDVNDPMMPIAWTREVQNDAGTTNRVFCTTMGAATDLVCEDLRLLIVNAVYWGLDMKVPEKADVAIVGEYKPSDYGFDGYQRGVKPRDHALGAKPKTSALPLRFNKRERIALVGNSLAERMSLFGNFEALLYSRFPQQEFVIRNFARPADAVDNLQRPGNYTVIDDPLEVFSPDTYLCFFGFNESFAGPEGESAFRTAYEKYLDEIAEKYPRRPLGEAPRFVLISPIAWEPTGNPLWPQAGERNAQLRRYAEVVKEVATARGLAYVDLFTPTETLFAADPGMQYTINGCHLNEAGDREVGLLLDRALFGDSNSAHIDSESFSQLRDAINDKSWVHQQDYRMLNGWYVYGGRRTWDKETFPREYAKIRAMAAVRDQRIWDIAQGQSPGPPDDSATGELYVPDTRFGNPRQDYSEPEELKYLTPDECIATMSVPEGFEVKAFASERDFPELTKPVQLNFDSRGRLWVSCMPTYPQWKPGNPKPSDRLLILEDTDNDGRADKCTTFYDKLHCPTGFEFWNGGVLVTDQPRLLWLKDTDGDDQADVVVHLLDGWASDDTHHAIGAYEWSNGGLLHMLEGVSMSTAVETPWGPYRHRDTSGSYVLDPTTLRIRHFQTPGYGNPWCFVFDPWGQGVVGDGTGANQTWATLLSGAQFPGRRGVDPVFNNQGMRPAVGNEFLYSRHLPDDVQGQFIYACVINMNGMPRFVIQDDGAGFKGERLMKSSHPEDLLISSDKNFRPTDPQIGPDGALWFGDWCNALIGHMQYSQRDPSRDHIHGRIYRLVAKDRPLLEPFTQADKSESELLDQLRVYEPRTRYRARRELRDRTKADVTAAVNQWVSQLDPQDPEYDRLQCEALWVLQGHHAVDERLLRSVLAAKSYQARAAATHLVADEREFLPDAFSLLENQVHDEHPRVRLEAVRGLSFFPTTESVEAVLAVLEQPQDSYLKYTLQQSIGALEPVWTDAFQAGTFAPGNLQAQEYLGEYLARQRPGLAAIKPLKAALDPDNSEDVRNHSYAMLEKLAGNADSGQAVFGRVCANCHKVGDRGYEFGPNLSDVGKRLKRRELIESIVEPSKKVDPKYVTTTVLTADGLPMTGFVINKDEDSITLALPEGVKKTFTNGDIDEVFETKQSSMPENLGSTIAPAEFLDVIEYLSTLK